MFDTHDRSRDSMRVNKSWQNEDYWKLPENVRRAVDLAESKSKNDSFCKKLENLNDKIFVFKQMFYKRQPAFDHQFIVRQKDCLS